ncbi:hypothetical protein LguiA_007241 [Lonicera macranthoides]
MTWALGSLATRNNHPNPTCRRVEVHITAVHPPATLVRLVQECIAHICALLGPSPLYLLQI